MTLIELIIAIALMGIIAVAFFGGLSNATLAFHFADVQTTAESLARSAMEYEKTQVRTDLPWGGEEEVDNYTVKVSVEAVAEGLQKITVGVFFHTRPPDEPVTTLVGYKRE